MLIDERLSRISREQFGDDSEPDILFTVEGLLKDVTTITVCRELDNASPENV